jgi:hypothetical protein
MSGVLRFMFDAGSGTCLWAADDAARAAFGYAVDHHALPLDAAMRARLDGLVAWHDRSIDWAHPGGPSPWDATAQARFAQAARDTKTRYHGSQSASHGIMVAAAD